MNALNSPPLRSIALQAEIAAPAGSVWAALTDAALLTCWFPMEAQVQPGPHGSIRLSWGEPVVACWQIEVWKPQERLSVLETRPLGVLLHPPEGNEIPRSVDFRLEPRDGKTAIKLLHDGFGCGPQWEEVYAAVRRGWEFQLHSLRHYLECHAGAQRSVATLRRKSSLSVEEVWGRLVGATGIVSSETEGSIAEGGRCIIRCGNNDAWAGVVCIFDPPKQFAAVLSAMNDSLFRIYLVEKNEGDVELSLWLASYRTSAAVVAEFRLRWAELLDQLFPLDSGAAHISPPPAEPDQTVPHTVFGRPGT